jgi:hypothetical protein
MIDMGMRENKGIHRTRIHWRVIPVPQPQFLKPLEQTAIHNDSLAIGLEEKFGPCDRLGSP